ncbi:MAG: hypothetical protein M3512_12230 [Bacteroidota bacterium]|nr:hypothetical protein [Bacteroidota bacterium]
MQTPPFPEHASDHSVVSSSVAVVLTRLAGEDFQMKPPFSGFMAGYTFIEWGSTGGTYWAICG